MGRLIKSFGEGLFLEFDRGRFDDWCIYFHRPGQKRSAILDVDVFKRLQLLGSKFCGINLYLDFVTIYQKTTADLSSLVLEEISNISRQYSDNHLDIDLVLTKLYAGMIAEENKDRAILKKRIKRLGVHQVLVEDRTPDFAANFSREKSASILDLECEARGF